jgi:hypothetical protein
MQQQQKRRRRRFRSGGILVAIETFFCPEKEINHSLLICRDSEKRILFQRKTYQRGQNLKSKSDVADDCELEFNTTSLNKISLGVKNQTINCAEMTSWTDVGDFNQGQKCQVQKMPLTTSKERNCIYFVQLQLNLTGGPNALWGTTRKRASSQPDES